MTTQDPTPQEQNDETRPFESDPSTTQAPAARVGTIVWGLVVLALATLIIISKLGFVTLNGTYVLIGLMLGAGAALVIGGLLSMRRRNSSGNASGNPR